MISSFVNEVCRAIFQRKKIINVKCEVYVRALESSPTAEHLQTSEQACVFGAILLTPHSERVERPTKLPHAERVCPYRRAP